MTDIHDIAIIGAGFAGLSCGARLRECGLRDFAIFEQGDNVGAFWRGNYERIRLHTPFHSLPGDGGLRKRYPQFMPRNELIDYFERYAQHNDLYPHLKPGHQLTNIRRDNDAWQLQFMNGEQRARHLVVATAYNRKPVMPEFPDQALYEGALIHSRRYLNAAPFKDLKVLVIGSGNSAAEIALDLVEHGADTVSLLIRGPRHVLSLRGLGIAARIARALRIELTPKHFEQSHVYTRTHPQFREKLAEKDAFFSKFSIDMRRYGIEPPASGPATQICLHGRVPWMDQGTVAAIRRGEIEVIDAKLTPLNGFTADGVTLGDSTRPFDVVIAATGMEPGLDDFFADPARFLYWNEDMARHMPITDGRSRSQVEPNLYFPGFDLSANGGLSLGLWGFEVADAIAAERT